MLHQDLSFRNIPVKDKKRKVKMDSDRTLTKASAEETMSLAESGSESKALSSYGNSMRKSSFGRRSLYTEKVYSMGAEGEKPALTGSAVACGWTRFFKIFCFLFHRLEKGKARPA